MRIRALLISLCLSAGVVLSGTGTAAAETYTNRFEGVGSSSFGFSFDYARAQARARAVADGFTDPATQCTEIHAWGYFYWAEVIWECTREI